MQKNIIGVDLGATSGRVILARAGGDRLRMEELHRFPNRMREIDGRFYWDIHALYEEILRGLSVAGGRGERIDSIGIDTWGVDFACVDPDGDLLGLPRAYRDPYTDGVPEEFFRTVPRESVYAKTGIQVMNFNSLYQLYALNREHNPALAAAEHVLFMPDALSYLLTGEQVCEYTILSTSQLMNPRTRELDGELLRAAGVDASLFARRVMPGERVGVLRDEVARRTGLGRVEVFAVAGHDTASAIAAVPAADERFAYLSSGTWSLMGIELPAPVITEESCAMNFTNEGGVDGTTRFLKNITGMWLLEECRRIWAKEGRTYTYAEIMAMAAANTLGIQISLPAAILLSVVSALGACGASGVAGGSLLLIPMACSLFGISNDIAMQVVGVGFIIGVIQDSVETCLNSASDVEFAATAEYHAWLKQGRQLPAFMYSKKERAKLGIEA